MQKRARRIALLAGMVSCASAVACGSDATDATLDHRHFDLKSSDLSPQQRADILLAKQNRIRQHFTDYLASLNVVATTTTDSGSIVDWTPRPFFDDVPPPSTKLRPLERDGEEFAQTELDAQPWNVGPEGTVPYVRFDVEAYLAEMGEGIPDDPSKGLLLPPSDTGYYHTRWVVTGSSSQYRGMAAYINIWQAPGRESGDHNLGQLRVSRGVQTVEAGKYQGPGHTSATLFAYFTTNNYAPAGNWTGGYSWDGVKGFVPYDTTVTPGVAYNYVSQDGGQQIVGSYELVHYGPDEVGYGAGESLEYQAGWWLASTSSAGTVWVGYWPRCHNTSSSQCPNNASACGVRCSVYPNWTFVDDSGLDAFANNLRIYGEVSDVNSPHSTTTDMGSGKFAAADYKHAAYMEWVRAMPRYTSNWGLFQNYSPNASWDDANCYDMSTPYTTSNDNWFFYGGPGRTSSSCTY